MPVQHEQKQKWLVQLQRPAWFLHRCIATPRHPTRRNRGNTEEKPRRKRKKKITYLWSNFNTQGKMPTLSAWLTAQGPKSRNRANNKSARWRCTCDWWKGGIGGCQKCQKSSWSTITMVNNRHGQQSSWSTIVMVNNNHGQKTTTTMAKHNNSSNTIIAIRTSSTCNTMGSCSGGFLSLDA